MSVRTVAIPVAAFVLVAGTVTLALGGLPAGDVAGGRPVPTLTAEAGGPQNQSTTPEPTPTVDASADAPTPKPSSSPAVEVAVLDIVTTGTMRYQPTMEPPTSNAYRGVYRLVDESHGFFDDPRATTFLFAHARTRWRGHSEGNDWLTLAVDDLVTVDGVKARVSGAFDVSKDDLAAIEGLWQHVPGRIVAVTCVALDSGEPASENRVIMMDELH